MVEWIGHLTLNQRVVGSKRPSNQAESLKWHGATGGGGATGGAAVGDRGGAATEGRGSAGEGGQIGW